MTEAHYLKYNHKDEQFDFLVSHDIEWSDTVPG